MGTCTDKYRIKTVFVKESIDGLIRTDKGIADEFYTQVFQAFNFATNDGLGQAEFRNTEEEDTTWFRLTFKYGYLKAQLCQVARYGETGRAGADNGNFTIILDNRTGLTFDVSGFEISGKAFQLTNINRWLFGLVHDAMAFALLFTSTNPATNGRQVSPFSQDFVSLAKVPLGDSLDKARNFIGNRTTSPAERFRAVEAAIRLRHSLFHGIILIKL